MKTPKDILIGWITSKWLQPNWTAAQFAEGILRDLDAAGYVIVPKAPTDIMVDSAIRFGDSEGFGSLNKFEVQSVWLDMINAWMKDG